MNKKKRINRIISGMLAALLCLSIFIPLAGCFSQKEFPVQISCNTSSSEEVDMLASVDEKLSEEDIAEDTASPNNKKEKITVVFDESTEIYTISMLGEDGEEKEIAVEESLVQKAYDKMKEMGIGKQIDSSNPEEVIKTLPEILNAIQSSDSLKKIAKEGLSGIL